MENLFAVFCEKVCIYEGYFCMIVICVLCSHVVCLFVSFFKRGEFAVIYDFCSCVFVWELGRVFGGFWEEIWEKIEVFCVKDSLLNEKWRQNCLNLFLLIEKWRQNCFNLFLRILFTEIKSKHHKFVIFWLKILKLFIKLKNLPYYKV